MERKIGNQTFEPISYDLYEHLAAAKCPEPLRFLQSTLQMDVSGAVRRVKSGNAYDMPEFFADVSLL